jgi:hypothetical protein
VIVPPTFGAATVVDAAAVVADVSGAAATDVVTPTVVAGDVVETTPCDDDVLEHAPASPANAMSAARVIPHRFPMDGC